MDDEKLIELVRSHPVIYDITHPKYMDNSAKVKIWNNIGVELGADARICKSRWANIRDNFRKCIQKNITKSGQGKLVKPYKFQQQLKFLVKFFEGKHIFENMNDEDEDITQNDESNMAESPLPNAVSPTSDPLYTNSFKYSPTLSIASEHFQPSLANHCQSSLSRRSYESTHKENHQDSLKTSSSEVIDNLRHENAHPVDIFLASLAPALKELHPCDLFDAKAELFAIVQKYELKMLRSKFPKLARESSAS